MHYLSVPRQISAVTRQDFKVTDSLAWQKLRESRPGLGVHRSRNVTILVGAVGRDSSPVPILFRFVF